MRRCGRLGDGWLASACNSAPDHIASCRAKLARAGRQLDGFPCTLATMWTYVTDSGRARGERLAELAAVVNRPAEQLAGQVLVGRQEAAAAGIEAAYAVADQAGSIEAAMAHPADRLADLAARVAGQWSR